MSNSTSRTVTWPRLLGLPYLQLQPVRAFRAARIIASDPDDLPQVFTIIESFSCDTLTRIAARMRRTETGRRMLADRPDIVDILADRVALARLPEGSLVAAYSHLSNGRYIGGRHSNCGRCGNGGIEIPAPLDWVHARMRDTHDLWHAATGYWGMCLVSRRFWRLRWRIHGTQALP